MRLWFWTNTFLSIYKSGDIGNNRSNRCVTEQLERKKQQKLCMIIAFCENDAFGGTISVKSILENISRKYHEGDIFLNFLITFLQSYI